MHQRIARSVHLARILACLAPLAACAAPTEGDSANVDDADVENTSQATQAIHGNFQSGGFAGLVYLARSGSSSPHTGILVSSDTVLTAASWIPASLPASSLTATYEVTSSSPASIVATDIVRHPTLDVALIKLRSPVSRPRIYTLDSRAPAALVGTTVSCWGHDAQRNVIRADMRVTSASSTGLVVAPAFLGHSIDVGDAGVPCFDAQTFAVVGIAGATATTQQASPSAFAGWIPGAQNLFGVRAQPLARPFSLFFLRNQADETSRNCLDIPSASTAANAAVNQFPCHFGQNQSFYLDYRASASYPRIVSAASGLCIDIPNASTSLANLQQYPCHTGSNQQWEITLFNPQGSGAGWRSRVAPNRCISGSGAPGFGGGLAVQSNTCLSGTTTNTQQRWFIRWN